MIEKYQEKTTPFTRWNIKNKVKKDETKSQKFIKRDGKYISLQDFINENNRECTIYDVLKIYKGDMVLTQQKLNRYSQTISDELAGIKGLKEALDMQNRADKVWLELPLEIRKEFNNDINKFRQNGLNWANTKIKERLEHEKEFELKENNNG